MVKTAVREALAEEGVTGRTAGDARPQTEVSQPEGAPSGAPKLGLVVVLVAVASITYLLLRRRRDSDETGVTRPSDVDEGTAVSDRVKAEAPVDVGE